ncbi:hypothetical protein R84B8_02309 [Treponema sp. R8-4-B8]
MNVNAPMAVQGTETVRLVRSTIGKTAPAQIAEKPGMRTERNRVVWFNRNRIINFVEIISQVGFVNMRKNSAFVKKQIAD